jgi:hypothetical protein
MGQLSHLLSVTIPDWTWAGMGALLMGLGGTLSGVAAIMTARRKGRDEAVSSVISRPDVDGGSRISDSNSLEPGG